MGSTFLELNPKISAQICSWLVQFVARVALDDHQENDIYQLTCHPLEREGEGKKKKAIV